MGIFRSKIYYPKSQITEGLYTSGKEFMTLDNVEYVGLYHTYSDGAIYTLNKYTKVFSKPLIQYVKQDEKKSFFYDEISNNKKGKPVEILSFFPKINELNRKNGYIYRYFTAKVNDESSLIYEISEDSYKEILSNKTLSGVLYKVVKFKWKISGPMYDVFDNNIRVESGVLNTNKRTVYFYNKEVKGLKNYLTDYLEFSEHKK